jgi:hypothetical protein
MSSAVTVEVNVREAHALELRDHAIKILVAIAKVGVDTSCKLHASASFAFVLDRSCSFEHLIHIRNPIRAAACAPGLAPQHIAYNHNISFSIIVFQTFPYYVIVFHIL